MPRVAGHKDAKAIGRRLKQARDEAGLSQRQLAKQTTMTAAYISRLEAGARTPTVDALRAFAVPLNVDPGWLETGTASTPYAPPPMAVLLAQQALDRAQTWLDDARKHVDELTSPNERSTT